MSQQPSQTGVIDQVQPISRGRGAAIIGPSNPAREAQNPDILVPPREDHGTLPNLRWSFADSHMHLSPGGWGRQTTARELPSLPSWPALTCSSGRAPFWRRIGTRPRN
jgi:oxalate decarboxylase